MSNKNNKNCRCNYCGSILELIWVHGHGQCSNCKINVEECCRGENLALNTLNTLIK